MPYSYPYPRPALAVDTVIFAFDGRMLKALLIERNNSPFKGYWALPGGFINMDEDLATAARRELAEETGVTGVFLEQLYTFGTPGRDPRGRTISVAYFALVRLAEVEAKAGDDAAAVHWFPVEELPKLAFDHGKVMPIALERLRSKMRYQPIAFGLLPLKFPLSQLQQLYETVLGITLDKRNFRKKVMALDILTPVKGQSTTGAHRPAQLYSFDSKKYERIKKRGLSFEL